MLKRRNIILKQKNITARDVKSGDLLVILSKTSDRSQNFGWENELIDSPEIKIYDLIL